jgi:two-component system cell cycle sensor histidine kinase/response regulator CckA
MKVYIKALATLALSFGTLLYTGILPNSQNIVFAKESQNVRVGVYDNYPKIYRDDAGQIKGFWVDITNSIAKKENWNVTYVYGSFDQGLERLRAGQIDMMVDVGVSPERQQQYDFNNEYVISGWAAL